MKALGKQLFEGYMKSVLLEYSASIHTSIKDLLPLFRSSAPNVKKKQSKKITMLKTDFFSCLYIVAQHREMDMNPFFHA